MTGEELVQVYAEAERTSPHCWPTERQQAALLAVQAKVREECAAVCEAQCNPYPLHPYNDGAEACAAAIRGMKP